MTIDQRIVTFVNDDLLMRDSGDPISNDEELLVSGLLDSIGVMRLVGFIETDLTKTVPPEDVTLENFSSISAILSYLGAQT